MRVILCLKNRRVKSQIPSTKLQIILKFQFSMTKTFGCNGLLGREATDCEIRVEPFPSSCSRPGPF